jgi:5-formyltetrahydrofolate cyclo-ligase
VTQSRVPRLIGERLAINGDVRPVVGFDQACYRLGYGGGFFDRILATMKNSPLKLGVGYRQQVLLTIHPQPNDVPMDMVNTEEGACLASKSSRPPKALAQ